MKKSIFFALLLYFMQSAVMASVGYYANNTLKLDTVAFDTQIYANAELQQDADGLFSWTSQGELQANSNEEPTATWQTATGQLHIPLTDVKIGNRWFQYKDLILQLNDDGRLVLSPLTPTPVQPHFRNTECNYDNLTNVECGFLVVPMNHQQPDYRAVHIAVAILKSHTQPAKPDPVVYLSGGPGEQSVSDAAYFAQFPYLQDRDLILLDPRGVGLSEPNLACPEVENQIKLFMSKKLTATKITKYLATLSDCHQRLTTEVVDDLSFFNTQQNATDLETLRQVLNIQQWNLLGVSYGTRWALTMMRDYPQAIRSVILDSPVPLQVDLDSNTAPYILRSFDVLFNACEQDATCQTASPNLKQRFIDLVTRLNQAPEILHLNNFLGQQGNLPNLMLTGDVVIIFLKNALYQKQLIPFLPLFINIIEQGQANLLAEFIATLVILQLNQDIINSGVHYSTLCREETAFNTENTQTETDNDFLNHLIGMNVIIGDNRSHCADWPSGVADAIENQPVQSDIPTVILTGEYDAVTPPVLGQILQQDLSQSHLFTLPGVAHYSVMTDLCALSISVDFLNQPDAETIPASACVDDLTPPQFTFNLEDLLTLM